VTWRCRCWGAVGPVKPVPTSLRDVGLAIPLPVVKTGLELAEARLREYSTDDFWRSSYF
jgi:hypothetical protein